MTLPDFSFEKKLHKKGFSVIAGVDEVGKGCFAGPVVAGCVVFRAKWAILSSDGVLLRNSPKSTHKGPPALGLPVARHPSCMPLINDSKQLTPKQREIADKWIRKNAFACGVGSASVGQINRLGIKKASEIAFRRAIVNCKRSLASQSPCKLSIDYLLIDAFYIPYVKGLRRKNPARNASHSDAGRQKAIVKGDTKSISIAGASIIAKVYRDKLMVDLGKKPKFRKYKWAKNKGYGTEEHRKAIKKYGITRQHRYAFVNTWLKNRSLEKGKS